MVKDQVKTDSENPDLGDPEIVKTQLIEKLIEENQLLLNDLQKVQKEYKDDVLRIKRDAAKVMEKLVQDNAFFKKEVENMFQQAEAAQDMEMKAKKMIAECKQERSLTKQQITQLKSHIHTLREENQHLEYESKHLGSAFLSLHEAVASFITNPTALEAAQSSTSWESRVDSPRFRSAVIDTVQATAKLRSILLEIESRLCTLKLIDVKNTMPYKKLNKNLSNTPLQLMGEKLIPLRELNQAKKEGQLWQKRYLKSQEALTRLKIKEEEYEKTIENKNALLKKLQLQNSVNANCRATSHSLRNQLQTLQKEYEVIKQNYIKAQALVDYFSRPDLSPKRMESQRLSSFLSPNAMQDSLRKKKTTLLIPESHTNRSLNAIEKSQSPSRKITTTVSQSGLRSPLALETAAREKATIRDKFNSLSSNTKKSDSLHVLASKILDEVKQVQSPTTMRSNDFLQQVSFNSPTVRTNTQESAFLTPASVTRIHKDTSLLETPSYAAVRSSHDIPPTTLQTKRTIQLSKNTEHPGSPVQRLTHRNSTLNHQNTLDNLPSIEIHKPEKNPTMPLAPIISINNSQALNNGSNSSPSINHQEITNEINDLIKQNVSLKASDLEKLMEKLNI